MATHNHILIKNTLFYPICQVKPAAIGNFVLFFSNYVHILEESTRQTGKKAGPAAMAGPVFTFGIRLPG
jgi:hypothetical protein